MVGVISTVLNIMMFVFVYGRISRVLSGHHIQLRIRGSHTRHRRGGDEGCSKVSEIFGEGKMSGEGCV